MNERLRAVYESTLPIFEGLKQGVEGISEPHFLHVPEEYAAAPVRLMVVGQQTYGWQRDAEEPDPVRARTKEYERFGLGRHYRRSPFWSAAHHLHRRVNPGAPDRGFLWSNLVKVDCNQHRPNRDLEDFVASLELLQREIEITEPQAVVFFTGPAYEERLRSSFPGVAAESLDEHHLSRLEHPGLPKASFRTYHPKYLRLSGRWRLLDRIADEIRASVGGVAPPPDPLPPARRSLMHAGG